LGKRPRANPIVYNRHRNDINPEYGLGEEWRRTFLSCEKKTFLPRLNICRAVTGAAPLAVPRKKKVRAFFSGKFKTYEIARCMIEVLAVPVPDARTSPNQPTLALQYAGTFC